MSGFPPEKVEIPVLDPLSKGENTALTSLEYRTRSSIVVELKKNEQKIELLCPICM